MRTTIPHSTALLLCAVLAWALCPADADGKRKRDGYGHEDADEQPAEPQVTCDQPAFGKTCWGMSQDEVRGVYRDVANVSRHKLGRGRDVANLDALTLFLFGDQGLVNVTVAFSEDRMANYIAYIEDYERVNRKLTAKYGEPALQDAKFNSEIFQADPASWGLALYNGDVAFRTSWDVPGMIVAHTLTRTMAGIEHSIVYESTELAGAYIEMEEKAEDKGEGEGRPVQQRRPTVGGGGNTGGGGGGK